MNGKEIKRDHERLLENLGTLQKMHSAEKLIELEKVFYLCDPKLNTKCKKTSCQKQCKWTTNIEYAQKHNGVPIVEQVIKNHG